MNISISTTGCYFEHKQFFDEMALGLQARGHRVGIITGIREVDPFTSEKHKEVLLSQLGFKPDFVKMWGANESIANGNLWKAMKMDEEDVLLHFDDDAKEIKRYTGRWVLKSLNSGQLNKF